MKEKKVYILSLLGAIIIVLLLRTFVCSPFSIPSQGMENSLLEGERILVNKWSYGLRSPLLSLFPYHRWNESSIEKEDIVVFNNPANIKTKAIDRKEIFINRCTALPGDTLWVDSLFQPIVSETNNPDKKSVFVFAKEKIEELHETLKELTIDPIEILGEDSLNYYSSFSRYEYYLITQKIKENTWIQLASKNKETSYPLIIPGKNVSIEVTPWNSTLLRNTLILHEQQNAEVKNDTLYINSQPVKNCTFTKDYYWMSSNNTLGISDSRIFGFVPHDHVIGKAFFIWLSKEPNGSPFSGYRWDRTFTLIR